MAEVVGEVDLAAQQAARPQDPEHLPEDLGYRRLGDVLQRRGARDRVAVRAGQAGGPGIGRRPVLDAEGGEPGLQGAGRGRSGRREAKGRFGGERVETAQGRSDERGPRQPVAVDQHLASDPGRREQKGDRKVPSRAELEEGGLGQREPAVPLVVSQVPCGRFDAYAEIRVRHRQRPREEPLHEIVEPGSSRQRREHPASDRLHLPLQ